MAVDLKTPPRISGEPPEQQIANMHNYLDQLHQALALALRALNGIRLVGPMATAISNPPTQIEVAELKNRLNAAVAACEDVVL